MAEEIQQYEKDFNNMKKMKKENSKIKTGIMVNEPTK